METKDICSGRILWKPWIVAQIVFHGKQSFVIFIKISHILTASYFQSKSHSFKKNCNFPT